VLADGETTAIEKENPDSTGELVFLLLEMYSG
jgi:hypothetical protein